jgi:hypothetical protein
MSHRGLNALKGVNQVLAPFFSANRNLHLKNHQNHSRGQFFNGVLATASH